MDYEIVSEAELEHLVHVVNVMLRQGWRIVGSVVIDHIGEHTIYHQTMTRDKS